MLTALVLALWCHPARAGALDEPLTKLPTDPPLKELRPGVFQLGDVQINQRERTVSFPAVLNLKKGAMEYLLVSTWGKVHESILRTETEPYRIHTGMLLLGAKGMGTNEPEIVVSPYVSHPSSIRLPGDRITVELKWNASRKSKHKRAEELVFNNKAKAVLARGNWVYNGSLFEDQSFLAQREGSVISLVTDPEALINSTAPGHDDDTIWTPDAKNLPPADVRLQVVIKLLKSTPARKG